LEKNTRDSGSFIFGFAKTFTDISSSVYKDYAEMRNKFFKETFVDPYKEQFGSQGSFFKAPMEIPKGKFGSEFEIGKNIFDELKFGLNFGTRFGESKTEIILQSPITINGANMSEVEVRQSIQNALRNVFGATKDQADRNKITYGKNQK